MVVDDDMMCGGGDTGLSSGQLEQFVRLYLNLSLEKRIAFNAIKLVVEGYTGPLPVPEELKDSLEEAAEASRRDVDTATYMGDVVGIAKARDQADLISYSQSLLTLYRQVRRGLIPEDEVIEAVRSRLSPEALAALDEEAEKSIQVAKDEEDVIPLTKEVLADKVLRGDARLSRFAVLGTSEPGTAARQGARLEFFRDLQEALGRKFLKRSLRTPEQIYHYLTARDTGVSLASLSANSGEVYLGVGIPSHNDLKEDILVKLEILMGSLALKFLRHQTPPAAQIPGYPPVLPAAALAAAVYSRRPDPATLAFNMLQRLRANSVDPNKLHIARVAHVKGELMATIKAFGETRKLKREKARMLARGAAAKQQAIETRRIQQEEREKKERMKALRDRDMDSYMMLIRETKNQRIHDILENTERLLQEIGAKVELERSALEKVRMEQEKAEEAQQRDTETTEAAAAGGEKATEARAATEASPVAEPAKPNAQYYTLSHRIREQVTQPSILKGGKLMPYQIAGLEFMISLYNNNISGILADEMGLGKTIQTIALIAYLKEVKHINGPHLIAVPLSTLPNWSNEFAKWCPSLKVIQYRGNKDQRRSLNHEVRKGRYNVLLTTFEYILREKKALATPRYKFIIVDEGHKMKNVKSKFHATLGDFRSTNRLLLTGTPLQNNLNELWALLNFLMPQTFSSADDFERWFEEPFKDQFAGEANREEVSLTEEEKLVVINRLHLVLRPFLLRRVKADVLTDLPSKREYIVRVQLSRWQQLVYEQLVNRCLKVRDANGKITSKAVSNVIMQLRKVVNHPYLFLDQYPLDRNLWRTSGKFEVLDRMLPKLLLFKHKTLIFSQMTSVMDILQDYLDFKHIKWHRLDGSVTVDERQSKMDDFNRPDSDVYVFMLSTRAGGLGVNLQAADTVIIFDSDWNPHQDLQAQARAHRVGQKSEVRVFRLVTVSPVEELILARASHKLSIDEQIIQAGMFTQKFDEREREERLRELLSQKDKSESVRVTSPQELNRYMARNDDEDEAFARMDMEAMGTEAYHLFFDNEQELEGESEGVQSQSAASLEPFASEDAAAVPSSESGMQANVSETPQKTPAATSADGDPTDVVHETELTTTNRDAGRIEALLISSGRLVSEDEIPDDILLPKGPKDEESFFNASADLGVRRSRLRAMESLTGREAAQDSDSEEENEEAPTSRQTSEAPSARAARSSRRRAANVSQR